MARFARPLLLALGLVAVARPAPAWPPGSPQAAAALAMCERADGHDGENRLDLLRRGSELAESLVATDPSDALAHFAVFCNLGRRLQATGFGFAAPLQIMRALRALDVALTLAPGDPDVLVAKGALTMELPRLFGGDPDGGEPWFRRALERDPGHARARAYLDGVLARRAASLSTR